MVLHVVEHIVHLDAQVLSNLLTHTTVLIEHPLVLGSHWCGAQGTIGVCRHVVITHVVTKMAVGSVGSPTHVLVQLTGGNEALKHLFLQGISLFAGTESAGTLRYTLPRHSGVKKQ